LLLVVVILTAISITTFQQFRPLVASPQIPAPTRTENVQRQSGPILDLPTRRQSLSEATARVEINRLKREETAEQVKHDQDFVALTKSDGTY